MKKVILAGILVSMLAIGGFANTLRPAGDWNLSNQLIMYNTTLTTAETVYTVTLTEPAVSLNIGARGGDIRWCLGGTTTEAFWTIPDQNAFWDHYAIPFSKNTVLYFWSTSNLATVEVVENYR